MSPVSVKRTGIGGFASRGKAERCVTILIYCRLACFRCQEHPNYPAVPPHRRNSQRCHLVTAFPVHAGYAELHAHRLFVHADVHSDAQHREETADAGIVTARCCSVHVQLAG